MAPEFRTTAGTDIPARQRFGFGGTSHPPLHGEHRLRDEPPVGRGEIWSGREQRDC